MIEKCEIASKHKENYLQLSCLAQTIQFWPVSGEKKMRSTPVYDKDGPREMQWDKSERNTSEKSTFQTSPNWRTNLPRLEDVLFQGLGAWRIIFFYFRKHFPKIHARQIPKMSDFYVFGPFLAEKTAVKEKKARFDPFVPPTHFQQQVGWGTRLVINQQVELLLQHSHTGWIDVC